MNNYLQKKAANTATNMATKAAKNAATTAATTVATTAAANLNTASLNNLVPKIPEVNLGEMGSDLSSKLENMSNLGSMTNGMGNIAENLFQKGMDKVNEGAAYVNKIILDPKMQDKVGEAAKRSAEAAAHILRLAEPGIQQLAVEGEKIAKSSMAPLFRATGQMAKDAVEAVPGVPLVFEAIDTGTAGLAAAAAGIKLIKGFEDAGNSTLANIKNSVGDFNLTNMASQASSAANDMANKHISAATDMAKTAANNSLPTIPTMPQIPTIPTVAKGGSRKKYRYRTKYGIKSKKGKRSINKTKRYRNKFRY